MLHALAADHDVAALTGGDWDPAETNQFYGTKIPESLTRLVVPPPWRWLSRLHDDQLTRLRMSAVLREARRLAAAFDLLITADNFAAFAKPGIQYVHFPARLQPAPARMKAVVEIYFWVCERLLGAPWSDAARNLTLANSRWTADGLARLGEVGSSTVLYPPVIDPGEGLPWEQRDDVFLCIGRFHGSKRLETSIAIVEQVRARALPQARLVIVGSAVDAAYTRRMRELAARAGAWIEFREDLSRAELNTLMGRSRYGVQAMEDEHFGMATAEMTRAGCLVFAQRGGGSPEVLNHEEALLWSTPAEVAARFERLDVAGLRTRLRAHARSFGTERFAAELRRIVATSTAGSLHRPSTPHRSPSPQAGRRADRSAGRSS
jgi:glycosyltransferase involved in cell wall biosynthesis